MVTKNKKTKKSWKKSAGDGLHSRRCADIRSVSMCVYSQHKSIFHPFPLLLVIFIYLALFLFRWQHFRWTIVVVDVVVVLLWVLRSPLHVLFDAMSAVFTGTFVQFSGHASAGKTLPQLEVIFLPPFSFTFPTSINCTNRFNLMPHSLPNKNQVSGFGSPYRRHGPLLLWLLFPHFFFVGFEFCFGHVSVFWFWNVIFTWILCVCLFGFSNGNIFGYFG